VNRLRTAREQAGLTQSELARRAGVSRQLVAAAEGGLNAPAVDAALRLAQTLGTTVESLFLSPPGPVVPALGGRLREGALLRIGRVGEQLVAAELADHGASGAAWARPDATLEKGRLRVFPDAARAGLVLAGCDPALGVAESMLQGLGARSLLVIPAATGVALRALVAGGIHAAVVHGPEGDLPVPPVPVARLHLARWQVGIGHPRKLGTPSLESMVETDFPFVQRERAASSQQALERALVRIGARGRPTGPGADGHIAAARTAATLAWAAVTIESAASAFDLGFLALEEHTVEIWVAERWSAHPGLDALGELLSSAAFTDRASQFGGYELAGCGRRIT
jgi:transcriptional regulator with XRE-family HTH domain